MYELFLSSNHSQVLQAVLSKILIFHFDMTSSCCFTETYNASCKIHRVMHIPGLYRKLLFSTSPHCFRLLFWWQSEIQWVKISSNSPLGYYGYTVCFLITYPLWEIKYSDCYLMAHDWQNWKSRFPSCPCHKIYKEEAVGLNSSNYTKNYHFYEYVKFGAIS